jgi:hypothetical protein
MAEIELNVLMSQCLNRKIDAIGTIEKEVGAWQNHRNNKECKINWQFTNKDARLNNHLLRRWVEALGIALLRTRRMTLFFVYSLTLLKKFRQSPQDITTAKGGGFSRRNKIKKTIPDNFRLT